jgi:hypothetical protein
MAGGSLWSGEVAQAESRQVRTAIEPGFKNEDNPDKRAPGFLPEAGADLTSEAAV